MEFTVFHELGLALGLGLIVGFQREWVKSRIAGVRTFPLITLLGSACALIGEAFGGWIPAVGLAGVVAFVLMSNAVKMRVEDFDAGVTTEVAALIMYAVGALIVLGKHEVAVVITGVVAVLLYSKEPLHRLVRATDAEALAAVFQLVLVGLVILPALPDEPHGPYGVINPFRIWLMVVLIVGVSLGGYVAFKAAGARVGTVLAGILGGLISSTATTVSAARDARNNPQGSVGSAAIILLASTVVFGRVMIEISVVAIDLLRTMAAPLAAMMVLMGMVTVVTMALGDTQRPEGMSKPQPPGLTTAISFGLLYMLVLLAVAWTKDKFGDLGLYVAAAVSGLTDMDAITLSSAELVKAGELDADTAWRVILVGAMANLVFKAALVGVIGNRRLFGQIAAGFGVAIAGGVALVLFWP